MYNNDIKINCLNCGEEFNKSPRTKNHKFCSSNCKREYYKNHPNYVELICDNCKKPFMRKNKKNKKYNHLFCSKECELEFKHKETHEIRNCEICEKEFECLKSSTKRFCSIGCQKEWQKTLVGELNSHFRSELIYCEWCNKEYYEKQYKINNTQEHHFCSNECRQEWYSKEWSQSESWKKESQKRAVRILEEGLISKTNSGCQMLVNSILEELTIKYKNEKGFEYCVVDNYLYEHNLIIEVMGTYWHADNRFYPIINYDMQVNRIRMDKVKHINIKKDYNIEILYLWEYDIFNNPILCKDLIKKYVITNGILDNYHSFNYNYSNNKLLLNDDIIVPYMQWNIEDLRKIISTETKEKMCKKQFDKWTKFNCEYCGKEREELTCHYKKHKHHYCSIECSSKARKTIKKK